MNIGRSTVHRTTIILGRPILLYGPHIAAVWLQWQELIKILLLINQTFEPETFYTIHNGVSLPEPRTD